MPNEGQRPDRKGPPRNLDPDEPFLGSIPQFRSHCLARSLCHPLPWWLLVELASSVVFANTNLTRAGATALCAKDSIRHRVA
jgi:hypothetical protein